MASKAQPSDSTSSQRKWGSFLNTVTSKLPIFTTVEKVHAKVGERGFERVKTLKVEHPSFAVPRTYTVSRKDVPPSTQPFKGPNTDFEEMKMGGSEVADSRFGSVRPQVSWSQFDELQQRALRERLGFNEIPPDSFFFPQEGDQKFPENVIDLTRTQEPSPLDSFLAARGMELADARGEFQVQNMKWEWKGVSYYWGKYVSDPIVDNVLHPIGKGFDYTVHQGKLLFSSEYSSEYNRAVEFFQRERYPYLVYPKDQVDAKLNELTRLSNELAPIIGNQIISDLALFGAVGGCFVPGPPVLKVIALGTATFQSIQAHTLTPQDQARMDQWQNVGNQLQAMIKSNQNASYDKSIDKGYKPNLLFKENLTKEELMLSTWGVDFLLDSETGFQFCISTGQDF